MGKPTYVDIKVMDATGQLTRNASVPSDATVERVVEELVPELDLPVYDLEGRPLAYHMRSERTGQKLDGNLVIGDVVKPGEAIRLLPEITAG